MGIDYGNLGIVYKTRGDLDKAIEYWEKSAAIFYQLKSPNYQTVVDLIKEVENSPKEE